MSAPSKTLLCTPASVLSPYHVLADAFPKYHPAFCDTDADIVLRSIESTLYRVHSFTLRNASGFFDTMFSLPQPNGNTRQQSTTLLDVYEGDFELERLLRLMFGLTIPRWSSLEELERVLNIAEKWDTPGPISVIRRALSSGTFIHSHPLKCYLIATHFGWADVARLASTFTLALNLYDPMHSSTLNELTSKALLPLLELHRRRRDMFKELLNSPERFAAGNSTTYHCSKCGVTQLDNSPWRAFKHAMFLEIERRPLGDTLGLSAGETAEWPEALACWKAKCQKEGCGGLNYDRIATLKQIRICVSLLPKVVHLPC